MGSREAAWDGRHAFFSFFSFMPGVIIQYNLEGAARCHWFVCLSHPHQSGEIGPVVRKRSYGWTQWSLRSLSNLSSFIILRKTHIFLFSGYLQAQGFRDKIVNRYTSYIRTYKALQTMKIKWKKRFENYEISQICQRQRNRLFIQGLRSIHHKLLFLPLSILSGKNKPTDLSLHLFS